MADGTLRGTASDVLALAWWGAFFSHWTLSERELMKYFSLKLSRRRWRDTTGSRECSLNHSDYELGDILVTSVLIVLHLDHGAVVAFNSDSLTVK